MTCSKIFSGDLPELTYEIIKYFQNDYPTLHSCILVNKLWCHLAIPLLWENPFSIYVKNHNFIGIYLHNINDDLKTKFNKYKVINNSLPSSTLFNYPKFLKYLNTYEFIFSVRKWFGSPIKYINLESISYLTDFYIMIDICVSLFKIFIENEVNLHTLEIDSTSIIYDSIYPSNILELILQNTNFIHNIKNLKFHIIDNNRNIALIKDRISQIINLQQNLKKILINRNSFLLCQSLFLSKDYNCSNTLNTIVFYYCNFKGINNLQKIFEQLNVLESVHILYCGSLCTDFIQQIINLTKPFKLKSLFVSEILQIESLQQLLQKSGGYIENFGYCGLYFTTSLSQQLLELITKYCKNINFLYLSGYESRIVYQMSNLIENIKQNLNYLLIDISEYSSPNGNIEGSSNILQNLGQALPSKLEYIRMAFTIKESDFRVFLENSQDIFINKLLIIQNGSDDILHYIKEYIMKERRVRYLAIKNIENRIDLFDLKDEVKEFELHNIIVRNYTDLYITVNNYIKNID
ncbi:hypothetical protein RhiirA1_468955 [Rhizophagus irregularis]|uniref:F-box domain-containing protein n=1 Tax=Rhizophagus irregularis TaxID=588596 RepID=A0A2N0R918_9GLOM|nr:hypothetical protein RhiirA1_468955 [Rhizophagus irregularis]